MPAHLRENFFERIVLPQIAVELILEDLRVDHLVRKEKSNENDAIIYWEASAPYGAAAYPALENDPITTKLYQSFAFRRRQEISVKDPEAYQDILALEAGVANDGFTSMKELDVPSDNDAEGELDEDLIAADSKSSSSSLASTSVLPENSITFTPVLVKPEPQSPHFTLRYREEIKDGIHYIDLTDEILSEED